MTKKLQVICIDDENDILESLEYDLRELEPIIQIDLFNDAGEAIDFIKNLENKSLFALVITDQIMPSITGSEFLKKVSELDIPQNFKTILLTGQASQQDTIDAVNTGHLDYYIAKPWRKETLIENVKTLLTDFLILNKFNPISYIKYLDGQKLLDYWSHETTNE